MHLARFPRVHFAHLPTPLEPMANLSQLLGGPSLFVKRDDCTGLATGGNKTRKLEFLIGDALAKGADTVITHGAVQSNHVRQTAAAACRHGLRCEALLERRVPGHGDEYEATGNVLLDRLLKARLHFVAAGTDMDAACAEVADAVRNRGGTPYYIPGGGSNAVGALGYVNAGLELLQQANARGLRIDCVVVGTGSTGTQAGLVCGLEGSNSGIDVLGICVRRPKEPQEEAVRQTAAATAAHLRIEAGIDPARVVANGDHVGAGYGIPTAGTLEAIRLAAEQEGLLLDPVYTGKALAGLIALCRTGFFTRGQNVVFLHTGGAAALFAYEAALAVDA
ncbi:MAG TPA: D-cysteine desulfhydrase [Geminicoccaceae bacterium]|nr:D-cysteine desulfhydrase [Geminicoccaceae bacterium]